MTAHGKRCWRGISPTSWLFPEAYEDIDWARGYENLDKELQQIVRDAVLGTRLADKLMKVWRRNGAEQIILIHTEIQGTRDADFPKRMSVYNYRLFDRYDRPVVSLAVVGDTSATWKPRRYSYSLWGCRVGIEFPIVKLRDYQKRWAELEANDNPFATVVMAHLQMRATSRNFENRLQWKMRLVRRLYERGYARQDVLELFRFIDWVLTLPQGLEARFRTELARFEEETQMPYITSIERMGIEQGIQQGEVIVLRQLLTRRFGPLPAWAEQRLVQASRQELESCAERVLKAQRLEDIFAAE
jgi:hypothetical protein